MASTGMPKQMADYPQQADDQQGDASYESLASHEVVHRLVSAAQKTDTKWKHGGRADQTSNRDEDPVSGQEAAGGDQ